MEIKKTKFPVTASEFMAFIEPDIGLWDVSICESLEGDEKEYRVKFWLKTNDGIEAYVAHEYGNMLVTIDDDYWFYLDRLHEERKTVWSWLQHIQGKIWIKEIHSYLIKELERVFANCTAYDVK